MEVKLKIAADITKRGDGAKVVGALHAEVRLRVDIKSGAIARIKTAAGETVAQDPSCPKHFTD